MINEFILEELKGLTVIKRDGRCVQFNSNRIKDAIRKAYEEVYKNDEKFKEDVVLLLPLIENKLKNKEETTVEEIQDIVIDYLSIADGKVDVVCHIFICLFVFKDNIK